MSIVDWFDEHNLKHIKAYQHFCNEGNWPKGFIPAEIKLPQMWHYNITRKCANAWIRHYIDKNEGIRRAGL